MSKEESKNYHDYFIKDGKFIGRFEEMYQNVDDPWHIDSLGRRLDMEAALLLLRQSGERYNRVLDAGCGKGYFTNLLLEIEPHSIQAMDVSETAVQKARKRYSDPRLKFFAYDLKSIGGIDFPPGHFDLIVLAQTIWCVLPELKEILYKFRSLLTNNGSLLISQHFLKPEDQKYGRDIISCPEDLFDMLLEAGFRIVATLETNRRTNHHLALLAKSEY